MDNEVIEDDDEVDPYLLLSLFVLYDMQNQFF